MHLTPSVAVECINFLIRGHKVLGRNVRFFETELSGTEMTV